MKCGSDLFVGSGKQQKWTCHLVVAIHKNFGRQMFFESINIDSCIVLNWLNWEDAAHNCWMLLTRTHWPTWFQFSIYFFPHHSVTESIQSASTSYRNSLRFILWLTYGCCLTMNGRTEIHRTVDCLILPFGMLWLNRKKLTIFISFICPNSLSLTKLYPNGTTHYWEKKNRLAQPDEQNVEEFGSVSFCHASITQFHVLSLPLAVLHTVPMLRRYFIRFHSVLMLRPFNKNFLSFRRSRPDFRWSDARGHNHVIVLKRKKQTQHRRLVWFFFCCFSSVFSCPNKGDFILENPGGMLLKLYQYFAG